MDLIQAGTILRFKENNLLYRVVHFHRLYGWIEAELIVSDLPNDIFCKRVFNKTIDDFDFVH